MTFQEAMEFQAAFCATNGAPITARVCRALAAGLDMASITGARAIGWAGDYIADAVPLRLVAPFHALFRAGRAPMLEALFRGEDTQGAAAIRAALIDHDAEVAGWLDGPPQTNATGRSSLYVGALLVLAECFGHPFELIEIGSSAGLNLLLDRYRYDLGGVRVGPVDSSVAMTPTWHGAPPPNGVIEIASVRGCDIAPIDLTDDAAAERLLSYVWVDQPDRIAMTKAAIDLGRVNPPDLVRADAADFVEAQLAMPQAAGTTRALMHSVVWQYLSSGTQMRIGAAMARAGDKATADRPLAWISFEVQRDTGRARLTLRTWPGDGEESELASAHPHGSAVHWHR